MPRPGCLDEPTIRRILTSEASHGVLARELGVNRTTISQIRLGKIHANVATDLPRWRPSLSCSMCIHWDTTNKACSLDLPDPAIEGLRFARDCACFSHRP
jgi:DNA-binding XRE family transcriptional regulator